MKRGNIFVIGLILIFSSCFGGGVDKRGSVIGYRNGVVQTEGGSFRIGGLPAGWIRKTFSYRAVLFVHESLNASISVNSFCKGSFDDGPLEALSRQIFYGVTEQKIRQKQKLRLDNRDALRTVLSGKVDGAPVMLDAVVLKMNECVFDLVYSSIPEDYAAGAGDFENVYEGFHYISGPRID